MVFATGFVLGAVRVFIVAPRIGVRWAEIIEAPLMILASFLAARFLSRIWGPFGRMQAATIGIFALAFMLAAEVFFMLAQGLILSEYIAGKDPISGPVYLFSLCIFAVMPLLVNIQRPVG